MTPVYKLSASSIKGRTNYGSMLAGNTAYVPPSFESIATVTVGSGGAADVTFSSIPSTFEHLQIRILSKASSSDLSIRAQFNADTGSNYAWHTLYGDGAGAYSNFNGTSSTYIGSFSRTGGTGDIFGVSVIDILDYDNTNKNKTVRSLTGNDRNGSGIVWLSSGLWQSTSAITSIKMFPESGTFSQYSHFALYGIKGAA